MTTDELKSRLSKFGEIQICKEGMVFTLLITGEGLTKMHAVLSIQKDVLAAVGVKYPLIECMKNEDDFFLYVLKSKN